MSVIGEVQKNNTEKFVVEAKEYKGKNFVDVRIYYLDKESNDWKPTKKGITLTKYTYEPLLKLITEAYQKIQ
ncbi:transcriptional coactivator p15 [Flexistipes sinusarabici DSM 4947]|uniref:Transcriptional coactivator p15 n=1 Tax=Flexistipes sinusarabici (strain ATCC 49648 / DSM 4947 / MAS 10) TaxID=717231 RepID=F8E3Z7_FLESM|nr:transcriptional coactivator p15/PC4 family protein [Flexistipes sinusarabici]AEI15499.1 transcriptional coactivator p15 [Flexistipes sinusarabici DSM 4947]